MHTARQQPGDQGLNGKMKDEGPCPSLIDVSIAQTAPIPGALACAMGKEGHSALQEMQITLP